MAGAAAVRLTANFEANLAAIATFWVEQGAPHSYHRLLDDLGRVVDMLERYPGVGRQFLARPPASAEGAERLARLRSRHPGADVRELSSGDYLMLYALDGSVRPNTIHLLAIRHHRQLSFDFEGYWR